MKAQRGIGSVYGTSRDRSFDRWFRYPAGFSADALTLVSAAVARRDARVVDPFCGAGTVPFALPEESSEIVGIEAHPLIAEWAALKLRARPGRRTVYALPQPNSSTTRPQKPCIAATRMANESQEFVPA